MGINNIRHSKSILVIFLLTIVISCTPILNNVYLYIFLWIILVPFILSRSNSIAFAKNPSLIICVTFFIFTVLLYKIIGISTASWGRFPGYLLSFFPFYLMLLIPYDITIKQKKFLFWLFVVVMLFNIGDSIRLSFLYPYLNVDNARYYKELLSTINLGGSVFFNISLFFALVCFFIFLNNKNIYVKLFMLSCVAFAGFYLLFFTSKASVIVYLVLALVLLSYAKIAKSQYVFYTFLSFSIIATLFLLTFYSDLIIETIIMLSPSERVSSRLVALIDVNSFDADDSSFSARENLWMISVNTWFYNPINFLFGIGDQYVESGAAKTGIGQHSDILDLCAQYGLMGLVLLLLILKSSFKFLLSRFSKEYHLQVITILVIYVLCGLTKKFLLTGLGCMVLFFLPLSNLYINKSNNK